MVNLESENGGLLQEVKNLQAQLASLQQSLVGVKPNQTEASNDVIAGIEPVGSLQYSANQTFFGQAPVLRKTKSLSDLLSRKVVEQPLEKLQMAIYKICSFRTNN